MATYSNAPAVSAEIGNRFNVGGAAQTLYTVPAESYAIVSVFVGVGSAYIATTALGGGTGFLNGFQITGATPVFSMSLGPGTRIVGDAGASVYFFGVLLTNQA